MRWAVAFLLVLSVVTGCRHHRRDAAGVVPTVTTRRMQRLVEIGSRDLSCPVASLSAVPVTERVYRVTGCGNWADYAIFGRRRHARWRRVVSIADRAAADLGCPAASIAFTPRTATAYDVVGCGRGAGYELRCNDVDCGWVGSPTAAAPAASGGTTASIVIIVPATTSPLSVEVDGEVEDDDEE